MQIDFQSIFLNLQTYWAKQGCVILQPYDIEVGAGANINIMVRSGDMNMHILGNVNQSIDGDFNVSCDNFTIDASRTAKITSRDMKLVGADSVDVDGGTIDLN